MTDSTRTYDMTLLVVMDCPRPVRNQFVAAELSLWRVSLSGSVYRDTVLVSQPRLRHESYFSLCSHFPYGRDLVSSEYVTWALTVAVPRDIVDRYSVSGAGLRVKRNGDQEIWDTTN